MAYIQRMRSDVDRLGARIHRGRNFLVLQAVMAGLAAITLPWRGTPLDRFFLNPIAYKRLAPLGSTVGIPFLLLGAGRTTTGIGVVPTPPLGMETSGRCHLDTGCSGCR
jgi:hypothetical protein